MNEPLAAGLPGSRIIALDLVRGVAVLGILAVNIAGFAGPVAATVTPHVPEPGNLADEAWFAFALLVFEGKMRGLFTVLFGASLVLFIDRAEARGKPGELLQFRRLGWLAVIGYLHFLLLWWGDILFSYALAGFAALALRNVPPRALGLAAIGLFVAWHALAGIDAYPGLVREEAVLSGRADSAVAADFARERAQARQDMQVELAGYREGFAAQVRDRLARRPAYPLATTLATIGETLPLMMLGMALYGAGFFSGGWSRDRLKRLCWAGIGTGGLLTALLIAWAWPRHFPQVLMTQALVWGLALPHLMMTAGYAALLVLTAGRIAHTALGRRVIAAGRMALSNYIGTTVVMTALFYGWGLGLIGQISPRWYAVFVAGGWALMLAWSKPWLARFGQGPLERAWRKLAGA